MNRFTKQVLIGSMFAFGLALTPAIAQHGTHGQGDRPHTDAASLPTSLPKCPVMDEPINLAISVDSDDGPVFFCCEDCISKYKANPSKYSAKVTEQRKALAERPRIQVTCPVSKAPVHQDVFVESNGKKLYFCCKDCVNKYQRNPAKYAPALANSYTYQPKCPVMGEDIDPKVLATTANGTRIYFCCAGCDKKFFKDPQKYAPNLVAQGFTVNAKEMMQGRDEHSAHDHDAHDHGGHDRGH